MVDLHRRRSSACHDFSLFQCAGRLLTPQAGEEDTLEGISIRFDMTPTDLAHLNHLHGSYVIPGQELLVKNPAESDKYHSLASSWQESKTKKAKAPEETHSAGFVYIPRELKAISLGRFTFLICLPWRSLAAIWDSLLYLGDVPASGGPAASELPKESMLEHKEDFFLLVETLPIDRVFELDWLVLLQAGEVSSF